MEVAALHLVLWTEELKLRLSRSPSWQMAPKPLCAGFRLHVSFNWTALSALLPLRRPWLRHFRRQAGRAERKKDLALHTAIRHG